MKKKKSEDPLAKKTVKEIIMRVFTSLKKMTTNTYPNVYLVSFTEREKTTNEKERSVRNLKKKIKRFHVPQFSPIKKSIIMSKHLLKQKKSSRNTPTSKAQVYVRLQAP